RPASYAPALHDALPICEGKPRTHDHEELAQLPTEWLFRASHLNHNGQAVDGVRPAQTPDGELGRDPGRPRIQQRTIGAPDREPADRKSTRLNSSHDQTS